MAHGATHGQSVQRSGQGHVVRQASGRRRLVRMDEHTRPPSVTDVEWPMTPDALEPISRRRLLALGAITGGGLVATAVAACSPAASTTGWTYGPILSAAPAAAAPSA